jgi:hypothetical protein
VGSRDGQERSAAVRVPAGPAPQRRTRHAGSLVLAALVLLLCSWVMAVPPGGTSDEPSHLIKAAALSIGDLYGPPVDYTSVSNWPAGKLNWTSQTARILRVPPGYAGCNGFKVPIEGNCTEGPQLLDRPLPPGTSVSYVATYPPFAYLPAALGIRLATALHQTPYTGLELARGFGAVVALVFLAGAGRLLRRRDGSDLPVLAGVALAFTPMVVLTSSQVGDSGLEITGALCFAAGLFRLAGPRPSDLSPKAVWVWTGLGGLVLACARPLGPAFLVEITAVVVLLRGRRLVRAVRRSPWFAVTVATCLAGATAISLGWEFLVEPHPHVSVGTVLGNAPEGFAQLLGVADMWVGRLGWIDLRLPLFLVIIWLLLIAGMAVVAARLGTRRERWALGVTALLAVLTTAGVWAGVIGATDPQFSMQARYVLPVLSMVPLVAVDVLREHAPEMARRWQGRPALAGAGVLVFVALGQAIAFETEAAAQHGIWTPPLHWETWEVVVTFAVLLATAGAVRSLRSSEPSARPPAAPPPAGSPVPPEEAGRPAGAQRAGTPTR